MMRKTDPHDQTGRIVMVVLPNFVFKPAARKDVALINSILVCMHLSGNVL